GAGRGQPRSGPGAEPPPLPAGAEDSFNVLDLAEYTKNRPWWRKVFAPSSGSSAEKYNVATQLLIGGVTGWCTGFIFQKVGKLAATAVGGGFFLLQIANHTGYIKVDWKLVERDMNKAKQQLKFHSSGNKMSPEVKSRVDEVRQLSQGVCRCLAEGTSEIRTDSWACMDLLLCNYKGGMLAWQQNWRGGKGCRCCLPKLVKPRSLEGQLHPGLCQQ
uniref:FUN14 domain-containing protein 2 n=1 Tax=Strigops habroptila TaxID=2489341 RepID=A0A672V9C6_STRHB